MARLTMRLAFVLPWLAQSARTVQSRMGVGSEAEAGDLWNAYVAEAVRFSTQNGRPGLQPKCVPTQYEHQGRYRGTIMMIHGFTACQQQFESLIPLVTSRGFRVLAPLLPGHGRKWHGNGTDHIGDMASSVSPYETFGDEMHAIMQAQGGEKVILGNSLGGTVATYMGMKGGYSRRMYMAPLMRTEGIMDSLISMMKLRPHRRNQVHTWGPGCQEERAAGRAGTCSFTPVITGASRDFGQKQINNAKGPIESGSMQIVFVDGDQAVSVNAIINTAKKYGFTKSSDAVCGMPAEYGHSFLSPSDNPTENKYWLKEATSKVADYLTTGKAFPQGQPRYPSNTNEKWNECQMDCTASSCPYTPVR